MSDLDVVMSSTGPVPKTSEELREMLVSKAQELSPGLIDNLPGSLIEDIVSTDVGALLICDQARVDILHSIGPRTANIHLLNQLAAQYGVPFRRSEGLTTVSVQFSGPAGFAVSQGFIVSDGTHQFALTDTTIIPTDGVTPLVTCEATVSGRFSVLAGTVNEIITSLPGEIKLTVTNPIDGVPASNSETIYEYRERVWNAGMGTVQGYPAFIRTELSKVRNIINRLTSVKQVGNYWMIMCGGGDNYEMAGAIFKSAGDISRLTEFNLLVYGLERGATTTIKTQYTHGFTTGDTVELHNVGSYPEINNTEFEATVIDAHTFTIPFDSSDLGEWDNTGDVTPNYRAHSVTINDWPDNYIIPFVSPFQQRVQVFFRWSTGGRNYLTSSSILQVVSQPVVAYINKLYASNPINVNTLKDVFLSATESLIQRDLFTYLEVDVTVNGVITEPDGDTVIISGDALSYWYIEDDGVQVNKH